MSSPQRRSSRIQKRNGSSNRNGTIINGHHSNKNTNSNRSLSTNSNGNGHKYSGRKRPLPQPSDSESYSSSSNTNDSDFENNKNNSNVPNNKRRRLNNSNNNRNNRNISSQMSELATQTQTTQTRNRRKISYKLTKNKWNVKENNKSNIKRRSTRIKYRNLADDTTENRASMVDSMNQNFMHSLVRQNNIYDHVSHPNEAYMDIEQAQTMSTILKEQTQTLQNEHFTITPNDYIKSLYNQFGINNNNNNNSDSDDSDNDNDNDIPKRINWSLVGQRFSQWFLTVASIQFMNGPLQQSMQIQPIEKKKKVVRVKKTFQSDAPVIQPKKVLKQKKSDKTETKSRVQHLRKQLKNKCTSGEGQKQDNVNPFKFLINPKSYSQTIENLFDLSFIMKEGYAQMNVNNSTHQPELKFISPTENTRRHEINQSENNKNKRNKRNKNKNKKSVNGQCIIKFNPNNFYNLINVYNIKESQIQRADKIIDNQNENDDDFENDTDVSEEKLDSDTESEEEMNGNNRKNNDKEEAD